MRIKSLFKEYYKLLLLVTIGIIVIFSAYLFFGYPFRLGNENDHLYQMSQFYTEYARMIREATRIKRPIFYSWNTFLGTDFYSSKAYYVTGDLLFILFATIIRNIDILKYLLFESIFFIYLGSICMYMYQGEIGIKNKSVKTFYSLIYVFCGCSILFIRYPMFFRFYMILPLLFIGVQEYLKKKKLAVFSIAACLLYLQNYYFMFPVTIFLPFYFIYHSYLLDKQGFNLFDYLKNSIKLIIAYIVGFLTSAIVMFPAIHSILGNSRLTYNELSGRLFWPIKTMVLFVYNLFISNIDNTPLREYFGTNSPALAYDFSIGISAIAIIGLLFFFRYANSKTKKCYLLMTLFTVSLYLVLPLNSLLHMGTTPTFRFVFILVFLLLEMSSKGIDNYISYNEHLNYSFLPITIISLLTVMSIVTNTINIKDTLFIQILISILFLVITGYLLKIKAVNYLLIILFIELLVPAYRQISGNAFKKYEDEIKESVFNYYKENDEDKLYRIVISQNDVRPFGASILNLNYPLTYGYMDLKSYDTTYEYSLDSFLNDTDSKAANNIFNIKNPELYKLLSVKYVASTDNTPLDDINSYEYRYNIEHLEINEIVDHNNIGFTFSNVVDKNTASLSEIDVNNTLLVDKELADIYKNNDSSRKQLKNIEIVNSNVFRGSIKVDKEQILFLSIPYNDGWRIIDNGVEIKKYLVDESFMGVLLTEGDHNLEFKFRSPLFYEGVITTAIGIIGTFVLFCLDYKKED